MDDSQVKPEAAVKLRNEKTKEASEKLEKLIDLLGNVNKKCKSGKISIDEETLASEEDLVSLLTTGQKLKG